MAKITIYSDGGTRNTGNFKGGKVKNTDLAAWAYLIVYNGEKFYGTGGVYGATNNMMELTAVIESLKKIVAAKHNNDEIMLYSDSKYIIDSINKKWLFSWQKKGWRKSSGGKVLNADLWQILFDLINKFSNLEFVWVKGHAENDGNNFVDKVLNETMDKMI